MNDKALEHAYRLFVEDGYTHGPEDFKKLIESNPAALNHSYELFKNDGYIHGIDDFKTLVGVGVKEPSTWDNIVAYTKGFFAEDKEDEFAKVGQVIPDALKKKEQQGSMASPSAESSSVSPSNNQTGNTKFDSILGDINTSLIDEDDEIIAKRLREKLAPYGVNVTDTKFGREAIALTIGQGKDAKTLEVPVDNFLTSNDEISASKIKDWLSQNVDAGIIKQQEEANKFQKTLTSQEDFNTSMKMINPNFIDNDKDYVVPELKGMFGDYGFKFEEAGFGYDAIKVTAPNGKTLDLSIDRFTDKGDLESSNELKSFIEANKPKIDNKVTEYDNYYKRYRNQQEVDDAFKTIGQETSSLIEEQKQLAIDVAKLKIEREKLASNPNPEKAALLQQKQDEIAQRSSLIMEKENQNRMNEAKLREAVGKFDRYKEEEGTWYKITGSTFLNGIMSGEYAFTDLGMYAMQKLMPDEMLYGKDADKMTQQEKDEAFQKGMGAVYEQGKKISKGWTSLGVSQQYREKAEENFTARNALGVVGFLPALGASMTNPYAGYAAFFAGGYDGAMEEMNNSPAFKDVSRDEKVGMATALGFVNAAIMKYNVTGAVLESTAGKTIVANVLKKMGSEASAKTVQEFAENEVKSAVGRGLLTAGASVPHGFGMGAEMKLSGDLVKKIYNEVKENSSYSINGEQMSEDDFKNAVSKMNAEQLKSSVIEAQNPSGSIADLLKQKAKDAKIEGSGASMIKQTEMFQFPETTGEYLKQVAESGLDMAVGSLMMSSIKTIGTAYRDNNFNRVNDATIENYKSLAAPEVLSAYEQNLNIKVANGEMTEANKNQAMDDARFGISVLDKMPDNLNAAQKRKAFGLIREREILEQRIEGKDKSLVKGETERITEINKELEDVSKQAPAEAPAAPEAQPAKPKTLDEIQDDDLKSTLNFYKEYLENDLKRDEKWFNEAKEDFDKKNPIIRFFSKKPTYEEYTQDTKNKLDLLNNNPEQYISDAIKDYEYYKKEYEEDGKEYPQEKQKTLDSLKNQLSKLQQENAIQEPTTEEAQPASKQIGRGDLKISVDGTTQGLGNIISENYSEKQDGTIKDKRFSVNSRNPVKVESTVKDNGNTELNVVVFHPDNVGRQGAVQFKIEIPKGVEVDAQEIENIVKEKTKQIKLDPQKDGINYKKGVESYLNDIVDNIIKPKENAIQEPTTEESVLRTEQPEVELPTMGEGNAKGEAAQEGVALEKQKEDIERRRKEELESRKNKIEVSRTEYTDTEGNVHSVREFEDGHFEHWITPADSKVPQNVSSNSSNIYTKEYLEDISGGPISEGKSVAPKTGLVDKINAKYDAELAELEKAPAKPEEVKPTEALKDVESTTKALENISKDDFDVLTNIKDKKVNEEIDKLDFNADDYNEKVEELHNKYPSWKKSISEAYHEAKADGSNPELVKAVEDLIRKPTEAKPIEQELAELEQMFPETKTGENKGVAASDFDAMLEMHSRVTDERAKNVIRTAYRLTKTLKSLFPNAEINIHETEESYNGAMEENNGEKGSSGNIKLGVDADGKPTVRIDIDVTKASALDVAHEVAHAVLQKAFGSNEKLFKSFQERIAKVISTDKNQRLLDFANNPKYKEQGVTYEEYMAELKAILSEEGAKIELSTAKKIAAVINEFVSKITNGKFKPFQEVTDVKQVVDFVNKVTEAMAKGESIDVEGAGKIGEGSRSSLREREITMPDGTKEIVKPVSPKIVNGFYSPLEKSILNLKASKWGSGEQVLNELKKAGAKPDELKWTGMEEWLSQQGKVSKDDILNFLDNNRIEILEVQKSENTKYSEYQLNGQYDNYKEILVTLPSKNPLQQKVLELEKAYEKDGSNYNLRELEEAKKELANSNTTSFRSSHWDEPNILVHLRMNTRTDAEGNKVLFLEEIQSDWGQKGKKEGFETPEARAELKKLQDSLTEATQKFDEIEKEIDKQFSEKKKEGEETDFFLRQRDSDYNKLTREYTLASEKMFEARKAFDMFQADNRAEAPSAPFVTDTKAWTKLGLKTAINEAIKQGVNKIAWTTGEQQGKRYDLSKQIDEIEYRYDNNSDTYKVYGVKNKKIEFGQSLKESELERNFGKDIAKKIISNKDKDNWNFLQGEDLTVGGSGMKSFYDNIIPSAAKSLVKEITGKEGVITETNLVDRGFSIEKNRKGLFNIYDRSKSPLPIFKDIKTYEDAFSLIKDKPIKNETTQQSIEITPELKQKVETEGMPLFSRSSLRTAEQVDKMVKDARASGYSEKAIEEFLKKRGVDKTIIDKSLGKKEAGKKIVTNEEMMPGYDKMMEDVNSEILRGLDRKTNETTIEKNVMKIVESSEAYKNATDQQKNEITREVKKAFGEKMKEAPSAEKIIGKEDKAATENANKLKDQIKLEAKAAKEGASSVKTAIKKIRDFVVNNKETANLTRKDLLKVIDIMKSVKDEKSLEKATTKVLDIIDKANKDIIEVSKTKMDATKMKAELKAAKDSAKGVVNKIKAVKAYFDSVQEYGNLTRKDLRRIMKEIASVKDEASLDKAVNNINDIIDKATSDKIEISEKKMIANTIKEVKLAKGNIKEKRKMIADVIDSIKKSGKLTASQVNALLKRANRLNVESFEHLNKFIEYTEKLFADADYDNKLSKGDGLRESIAKLSKNKGNKYNASLVALAEKFLSIKPSMVDDIDQYNKIASDLKDAVKGSSAKGFKSTVDIKAVDAYVDEMMTSQKEKLTEAMREQVNELLGVDGSTLTYEEMQKMLEKKKEDMSDEEEKIIRSAAIKLFDTLSSTINHILETGKDPFTGEAVDIKESKKDVVKRFMEMDLTKMDIKDAIAAVDSLNNFIVNESTAKMEKVLSKYNTKRNMEMLIKNKITSSVLKIFRSGWLGRGLLKQLGSETILMDALFKGTGRASIVAKAMGLSDYKSNVSKAKAVVRNMVADYVVEFYKKEANGEAFNTAFNNTERGMLAFMSRVKIGKEDASFKDRKSLVEQSIEALRNGDEKEVEKADLYQEVYDKILKDSKNIDDVKSKVDETNAKAVDFWIEKWAENYEELADVSENIHNVILGKFGNYTPDVVKRVKEYSDKKVSEEDVLDSEYSAFLNNSGIVQKKSGRLEKTTVEDTLPENSYYDFGFDNNNSSLMSDALIDAKTAGNVIELSTFLNSPEFNKIVITSKERNVLKSAISGYVRAVRGKEKYNYDEVSDLVKSFNRASALGASYVLGGVGAIPKQYLVPAVNTMIASGGNLPHFDIWWNKAKQDFVNNSGESVAIRGVMSNADIKNIDNLLQEAAKSKPEIALRKIEEVNKIYLKHFLVNRDVAIAKASWLTYYEKGLRKQGKFTTVEKIPTASGFIEVTKKGIDYSKHELNKEAAQYATRMVDRQQNISDEDFRGRFYSNKEGLGPIVTKVLLPFASFRINQWLRMNTDLGILTNKTTTYEDRLESAKSLAATGTEIAFFNFIGMGISAGLHSLAISAKRAITGASDDEEDKEKQKEMDDKYWKNLKKSKGTALVQDFFSPLPVADPLFEVIAYNLLDKLQSDKKEEDRINIFDPKPTEVESWLDYAAAHSGGAGILLDRISKFKEIASAYLDGKIETTAYGETTEKNIREKHKGTLGALTTLAFLNTLGVFPAEVYNAQNTAFKEIKKEASTKTEAEIIQTKAKKREKRADNIQKIQIINQAINEATDQDVVNELMKMKRETRMKLFPEKMSDEAKEVLKEKRKREKDSYQHLLGGYDTKEDLKRYNPDLYEQNFGEGSNYYATHEAESKAEKLYDKVKKQYKDDLYNYTPPPKKKKHKKKKNSDGSYKKSSYSYSYSSR